VVSADPRVLIGRAPAWLAPAAAGAAALGVCGPLLAVDPNEPGAYGLCPFRAATGLDCPGCGTLRALHALLGGDLARALDHNVLTVAVLPVLVVVWLRWSVSSVAGRPRLPAAPAWFGYGVAGAAALFLVVRNLPWAPFLWLGSGAG
jgi:hypothetical protein